MTIIKTQAENGFHDIQRQSHRMACWLPGYVEVPPHLESDVWASGGWCDLMMEDGSLIGITPTEKPKEPTAPPTELEQLRADVDFLAAMTGVMLV